MRWSDSGTKNFSRAASLSSARSGGRKKAEGTLRHGGAKSGRRHALITVIGHALMHMCAGM